MTQRSEKRNQPLSIHSSIELEQPFLCKVSLIIWVPTSTALSHIVIQLVATSRHQYCVSFRPCPLAASRIRVSFFLESSSSSCTQSGKHRRSLPGNTGGGAAGMSPLSHPRPNWERHAWSSSNSVSQSSSLSGRMRGVHSWITVTSIMTFLVRVLIVLGNWQQLKKETCKREGWFC